MTAPAAPFKTAQGLEELQLRTRKLGQRYRTVLLLVDGRRPLGEVLAMAHSAGAETTHFEELVRLGLVEVPTEAMAPEPRDSGPVPLDVPTLTSVVVDVPSHAPAHAASAPTVAMPDPDAPVHIEPIAVRPADDPPPPRRRRQAAAASPPVALRDLSDVPPAPIDTPPEPDTGPDTVANPEVDQPFAGTTEGVTPPPVAIATRVAAPAPAPVVPAPVVVPPAPPRRAAAPSASRASPPSRPDRTRRIEPTFQAEAESPFERTVTLPTLPAADPPRALPPPDVAPRPPKRTRRKAAPPLDPATPIADHARPRAPAGDEALRLEVRQLLGAALGAEATLFSPMTLSRLRHAQTERELITLVWEIERQRTHVNRSRAQMLSLERARELLGMGNTVVAMDVPPDTTWPDTQP